eukprot:gene7876-8072_t
MDLSFGSDSVVRTFVREDSAGQEGLVMGAATRLAAIVVLLAVGQAAAAFEDADIAPVPSRHLLETSSSTVSGYGGDYSYGYGGYGDYGYGGHHRFLMEYGGYEDGCKSALYKRCQTEPGLPCEWLDQFYGPTHGPAHSLPHEAKITGFVYEDCTPQPPCACSGLRFDGSDSVPAAVACCTDLRVACKTSFSGLCCKKVEDFCYDDKPSAAVAAWAAYRLHHSDCSEYPGVPYLYTPPEDLQHQRHEQQPQQQPTEAELLKTALLNLQQQAAAEAAARSDGSGLTASLSRVLTPQVFIAAAFGFMCVVIVAIVASLGRRTETHLVSDSDDSDGEQEQQEGTGGSTPANLSQCLPDSSCCGTAGTSRLTSVVSVGHRTSLPGLREPLLPQHGITR